MPGGLPGEFENTLDIALELIGPSGTVVASGQAGSISHTVTENGTHKVRVFAQQFSQGEYVLSIAGATNTTRPTIFSIARQDPTASHTNADQVTFRVTFSEDVTNVTTAGFLLSGTVAGDGSIGTPVQVSPSVYDIPITGLTNSNGTIDLDIANGNDIQDLQTLPLGDSPGIDSEEIFIIDNVAPVLTSFARFLPAQTPTGADLLIFQAIFDEDVTNVDTADFVISGATTATVSAVSPVDAGTYNVTVSGGNLAGFSGEVGSTWAVRRTSRIWLAMRCQRASRGRTRRMP